MLAGKIFQPQYKNNEKTKVLKAYNSQTKGDRCEVLIQKTVILPSWFGLHQQSLIVSEKFWWWHHLIQAFGFVWNDK